MHDQAGISSRSSYQLLELKDDLVAASKTGDLCWRIDQRSTGTTDDDGRCVRGSRSANQGSSNQGTHGEVIEKGWAYMLRYGRVYGFGSECSMYR